MRRWLTIAGFLLPFVIVILVDVWGLQRRYYHHFGDYCGLFSLGLGWLEDKPYVNFPWPLWGLGQFSALAIRVVGIPTESLFSFNLAWVGLNIFSAIISAWITARLLEVEQAPAWAPLVFGSVIFVMPMVSTGWIHSNPYFALIVLSGPTTMVVLRRMLNLETHKKLCQYEQIALLIFGYISANNFATGIIVIGLFLVYLLMKPMRIFFKKVDPESSMQRPSVDSVFVLVGAVAMVSLAGYFQPTSLNTIQIAMLLIVFSIVLSYLVWKKLFSVCEKKMINYILLGWLAGVNILVFQFGQAAKIAMGTSSAPVHYKLFEPWPRVNLFELGSGTHWFMFLVGAYALGVFFFVKGVVSIKSKKAPILIGGSVLVLIVLYLNGLIAQIPFIFPIAHSDLKFGLTGRYLWTSAAAVYVAMFLFFLCCKNAKTLIIFCIASLFGVAFAFYQSIQSKNVIIAAINRDCQNLDELIDEHLQKSPKNLVLMANAIFPSRATLLYAYHNSRTGIGRLKLESINDNRIQYIGRYGGAMWRSPYAIIKEKNLSTDAILIIAEMGRYPDEMVVIREFPNTGTYALRLAPPPLGTSF